MVKAKFKVDSVTAYESSGAVELSAVTSGSEENKRFWKYTPAGNIHMQIDNDTALNQFKPGMEFYVTFDAA